MIPDYIIDKAVAAAGDNWVLVFDWEHDKLYAQVHAALEAVAADIWDQGQKSGLRYAGRVLAAERIARPDLPGAPSTNPYRIEHT